MPLALQKIYAKPKPMHPIPRFLLSVFLVLLELSVVRGQVTDLPPIDALPSDLNALSDEEVRVVAERLLRQATDVREVFARDVERAALEHQVLEEQLSATLSYGEASPEDIKALRQAIEAARAREKTAQQRLKKADQVLASLQKNVEQPARVLRKGLPKMHRQVQGLLPPTPPPEKPIAEILEAIGTPTDSAAAAAAPPPAPFTEDSTTASATSPTPTASPQRQRPTFRKYDPRDDVLLNPPMPPCALTVDTRDEFSGERRREVAREELFRYTNPALRPYLQGREHIVAYASVAQAGKLVYLQLTFVVQDANAKRTFGSLPKNSAALLKFLDGETLLLSNLRADEGRAGDDKITHTFVGQYALDASAVKKMQRSLLDKMRIAWSTGYEDYEVHQVDLIARQLRCLFR